MKARQVLIKLILGTIPATITGTVKSVDESDFTCVVTPSRGGPDFEDVRLKVAIDENDAGIVCIPDLNSEVVISCLFNNEHAYYVTRFSKIKKWHLKTVSGRSFEITGEGKIKINGDQYGGIPKSDKISAFMADMITAIGAGFSAVGIGGAANGPAGKTAFDSIITAKKTAFDNTVKNTNVTHG
jgi:hypothetical protein